MIIIKRDNRKQKFNKEKIYKAIFGAMIDIGSINPTLCTELTDKVVEKITLRGFTKITVEEVQDLVQEVLIEAQQTELATNYILFRKERSDARDLTSSLMNTIDGISKITIRDNANVGNGPAPKMLQIGSEASKWYNINHMPKVYRDAHNSGDIHVHDLDFLEKTINCLSIDLADILQRGFSTSYGWINKPKSIQTAGELLCIIMQSTQNDMYGGQAIVDTDNALAPYVELTRNMYREYINDEETVEKLTVKAVKQACQGIIYNLNSMHSRSGSQTIFSSLNIGIPKSKDAALICEFLIKSINEGLGKGETPIFPTLVFHVANDVNRLEESPYHYLYKLAIETAAKRMNPNFLNCDGELAKPYYDKGVPIGTMGCRAFTAANVNGRLGTANRGNGSPVTFNMPRLALRSKGSVTKFFTLLDDILSLCEEQLLYRKSILGKLTGKDLPFLTSQGLYYTNGVEVGPDDSIEPMLVQATWAIGYIGLAETLKILTGKHHGESKDSDELGIKIMKHMREFTDSLIKKHHLNFVLYPTPAEGISGRFPKLDEAKFGPIEWVTTKGFYTNSFHVPPDFDITVKEKIDIEVKYHVYNNAGVISYIELKESPHDNPVALKTIVDYFCEAKGHYFGINYPIDECLNRNCNHRGVILNECPVCGGRHISRVRRVTGYLSYANRFTPGKTAELNNRVVHK